MNYKIIIDYLLRPDRLKHFFVGTLLFLVITLTFGNLIGLTIVFLVGLGKEIHDIKTSGFDIVDLIYTIAVGVVIIITDLI